MSYPTDRKYTKEHEWITADGKIGITTHAQDSLGDIVFVELPKVGHRAYRRQDLRHRRVGQSRIGSLRSRSGTVTEVNGELATAPENVNKDAHAAWMVKIARERSGSS